MYAHVRYALNENTSNPSQELTYSVHVSVLSLLASSCICRFSLIFVGSCTSRFLCEPVHQCHTSGPTVSLGRCCPPRSVHIPLHVLRELPVMCSMSLLVNSVIVSFLAFTPKISCACRTAYNFSGGRFHDFVQAGDAQASGVGVSRESYFWRGGGGGVNSLSCMAIAVRP